MKPLNLEETRLKEEMKGYLIQRIDTFKEILSKFKKIIGSDINVGSKGGKE